MRDVTDNVTGELEVTVKRGRGRPRKEGALTNAQRQAAYRARRRQQRGVEAVGGDSVLADFHRQNLEELEETYLELDQVKAELAEAHETIDEMTAQVTRLQDLCQLRDASIKRLHVELGQVRNVAEKSVTPAGNVNAQQFEALLSLLDESCKVRRTESLKRIADAPAWVELVAGDLKLPNGMREALERAVMGQTSDEILVGWDAGKTVTRKAVTKK